MAPTWEAAERYLLSSARFGRRPGLHRIRALLARLDDPHLAVPHVIHVGGTNGKGSVVAGLDAVLRAAGLRVARYTSPHLQHFRERIAVDGQPIDAGELARLLLEVVRPAAEAVAAELGDAPVTFELLTAALYVYCREQGVPWLVQEVGLGGRHDATNVVPRPVVAVITNVDLDHTERLGTTVEAIAEEKAGIIKPGVPVVTAARGPALERLAAAARRVGAPLVVVSRDGAEPPVPAPLYRWQPMSLDLDGGQLRLLDPGGGSRLLRVSLRGEHQLENAAVVAAAVDQIARGAGPEAAACLTPAALAEGLASARCPGRMAFVPGQPPLLLDAAHNGAGMAALRQAVERLFPGRSVALVMGATTDRDADGLLQPWAGMALACATVTVSSPRAVPAAELARRACRLGLPAQAHPDLEQALAHARAAVAGRAGGGLVVACGSILLVAEVLRRLPAAAAAAASPATP